VLAHAALGCTELTSLGISSEQIVGRDRANVAPTHYSALTVGRGEAMLPNAYVGDIDGDGLDDLLIGGMHTDAPSNNVPAMTLYLFYGRSAFPETLAAEQADATFETGAMDTVPLGDINGDGFVDFVLGDETGYEFVFGKRERFAGHHAKFTAGMVRWRYGEPLRNGEFWPTRFYRMSSLGDINGDGADEIGIELSERSAPDSEPMIKQYLFEGRADGWPSGTWDPSWAAADFGTPTDLSAESLYPWSHGDFDGDGNTDIIARQDNRYWLFYGRAAGLHGMLTATNADAELVTGSAWADPMFGGDLDGDGADDLQIQSSGELQIVYGSPARYSGIVRPQADLTFADTSGGAQAADLNADGLIDLLLTARLGDDGQGPVEYDSSKVYEVRGNGARLTGRYQLQPEQLYKPVGYAAPEALDAGRFSYIDGRSDFDGDGSSDLLMVSGDVISLQEVHVTLYVLPGTSRAPD
jgi:hypothetical protein